VKRVALASVVVLLLSVGASAAPADCLGITTLAQLLALPATGPNAGCQHQDKIFSNFTYSLSDAADVNATHVFSTTPTFDIHGWNFSHQNGTWLTGFTLAYTVTIDTTVSPNQRIFIVKDQQNSGEVPNGTAVSDVETGAFTTVNVNTNGSGSGGAETSQMSLPNVLSLRTTSTFTPGGGQLLSWEQQWFEHAVTVPTIPEPATLLLSGGALILVGLLRRRRRSA
jgi:hypothetical protein